MAVPTVMHALEITEVGGKEKSYKEFKIEQPEEC